MLVKRERDALLPVPKRRLSSFEVVVMPIVFLLYDLSLDQHTSHELSVLKVYLPLPPHFHQNPEPLRLPTLHLTHELPLLILAVPLTLLILLKQRLWGRVCEIVISGGEIVRV